MHYKFDIFADYFQFTIEDENIEKIDPSIIWTDETLHQLFYVSDRSLLIVTARSMEVPVEVQVSENRLALEDLGAWDHVIECSIETKTGKLVIHGNTYYSDAPRISLNPGWYQVTVYYGGLDTLSDDGLDGDDRYKVVIQPGTPIPPKVLKPRQE